jgi:hypothetical protein
MGVVLSCSLTMSRPHHCGLTLLFILKMMCVILMSSQMIESNSGGMASGGNTARRAAEANASSHNPHPAPPPSPIRWAKGISRSRERGTSFEAERMSKIKRPDHFNRFRFFIQNVISHSQSTFPVFPLGSWPMLRRCPGRSMGKKTRIGFPKARHEFDAQMSRSLVRIVVQELTRKMAVS